VSVKAQASFTSFINFTSSVRHSEHKHSSLLHFWLLAGEEAFSRADRQAAADVRGGGGIEVKCKELLRKSYLQGHNLFSVSGRNPLKLQQMSDGVVKSVAVAYTTYVMICHCFQ